MNSERLSQAEREIGGLRADNNQLRQDESNLKADLRAASAELTYVCVGGREEIERRALRNIASLYVKKDASFIASVFALVIALMIVCEIEHSRPSILASVCYMLHGQIPSIIQQCAGPVPESHRQRAGRQRAGRQRTGSRR